MTTEQLTAILLAAIAAPGFWEVLKSLIDKTLGRKRVTNEDLADRIAEVKNEQKIQKHDIDDLKDSISEMQTAEAVKEATSARRRILRFNDEILRDVDHSKEYFDDILEDIKTYEDFCAEHRDFTNGKTVMATKNIQRCYEVCMEKHNFLS